MAFKLICFDMDGVIFRHINFWLELHKAFGTYKQGRELTERLLHKDYDTLVEEVVGKLWKGKPAAKYFALVKSLEYFPGVEKLFNYIHTRGLTSVLITGGSIDVARRVQQDFGVDYVYGNELLIRNGRITGEFIHPIGRGFKHKLRTLERLCRELDIKLHEVICIADDMSNIDLFRKTGLRIAFNPDSEQMEKASTHVVYSSDLSDVIPYLS